jgi:hypothetical protein
MSETQVKRETSLAKVGYKTGCLKATEPIAHGRAHDMRDAPQVPLPSVGQRRWGVYTWAYRLYSSILYRAGPSGDRTGPAFLRCIMQYASVSSPSLKGGVSTTARLPSDEFDPEGASNVAHYIVGQVMDGLMKVGAICPVVHKFADDWRAKFAGKATEPGIQP